MNRPSSVLPVRMARRVSHRFAQCVVAAAAGFVLVSLIGCGIVRQSFEKIAAKQAVLAEIGVKPFVSASHFLERGVIENIAAGSFFGAAIGLAAGTGIFFACVLVESIPYRRLKLACMALLCLLLAYLSHQVFRTAPGLYGLLVWSFPAAAAAACEIVSPTPFWKTGACPDSGQPPLPEKQLPPQRSGQPRDAGAPAARKTLFLLAAFNAAAAAALILWVLQSAPITRHDAARKKFFTYFRDDMLLGTAPGRALDRFYYRHSPYAAEYVSPTQFQPVTVAAAGLDENTAGFIGRHYGSSLIPVYTVSMPDIDTAAKRFTSGSFDIMVLQPSSFGMTPEEAEDILRRRGDLPENWSVRCVIITDRRQSEPPVWIKRSKVALSNAVRRAVGNMTATAPSEPVRNLIYFGFIRPLLSAFRRPLFPTGFLIVVVWISLLITAWSARRTPSRAVSISVSALFAAALWWMVIAGMPERAALADTLRRLDGPMPSARELERLLSSEAAEARYAALRYLTDLSDTAHVERALELFRDPDPRVRMRAVHLVGAALKRSKSHPLRGEAVPRILNALDDESFHVRYTAAEAIASAGIHEAGPRLEDLVRENRHLYVTWYAVNALRRLGWRGQQRRGVSGLILGSSKENTVSCLRGRESADGLWNCRRPHREPGRTLPGAAVHVDEVEM